MTATPETAAQSDPADDAAEPDLRRLLMWEGFVDHPMRKDYVNPDDDEAESEELEPSVERT